MSASVLPVGATPRRGGGWIAALLILVPLALIALAFASKFGYVPMGNGARVGMIFALLLAMMLTGMPISIALGLTVLTYIFTLTTLPVEAVALKLFTGIEKFEIMAIPFFILAGNFLTHGGVARRMINFATSMVGHWHGGLALAGVIACSLFAAVSGSSPATVVAIGSVVLPAMVAQGFPKNFGAGVITTSGSLGILIPPSIPMVIYAVSTNTSVGALFMAGVVPGLMIGFGLMIYCYFFGPEGMRRPRATFGQVAQAVQGAALPLMIPVILLGGILTGWFTPTEAGVVAVAWLLFVVIPMLNPRHFRNLPNDFCQAGLIYSLPLITIAALRVAAKGTRTAR